MSKYFIWSRITDTSGSEIVVDDHFYKVNIDILYDADKIKLLGTQGTTLKNKNKGRIQMIRLFY